ncbi:hypothetical protein BZG06_16185 [Salinivibrio kushneri]|nr:DUF6602 domain-containing protein [Salinivibrio kushneri]OOE38610.1 hypothetical protein BZG06_16185 [Salinivibrio kushneri]
MLAQYDIAKLQMADDPVKVEHGKLAESLFREYCEVFLPKKYGICKGYIVTREPDSGGSIEEWDVIVYDALEAPVLFVRDVEGDRKRGIPIEYVKAVIEVKATLSQNNAAKVNKKLSKLKNFLNSSEKEKGCSLSRDFFAAAVFFETKTSSSQDYKKCLSEINNLAYTLGDYYEFSLILRSQHDAEASGVIHRACTSPKDAIKYFASSCEFSEAIEDDPLYWYVMSSGFSERVFPYVMMEFIDRLNEGWKPEDMMSNKHRGYGSSVSSDPPKRLWP